MTSEKPNTETSPLSTSPNHVPASHLSGNLQVAPQRRNFLRKALGAGAALSLGGTARLASASAGGKELERRLSLINDHTWERLDIVYWTHGMYIDESLDAINHLMRDHRENTATVMDRKLLDDLYHLSSLFSTREPLHILSGYRTPRTNARLRKRSSGVAKYSLHMEGRAADIYLPGIETRVIREAALSLQAGGVGYYASHGFVHMDTGRVRQWGS